jgi:hypothetical protein
LLTWLRRNFLFRLLVVAPAIVGGAYFALWACAPAATLPSPVPMTADRPNELGLSGTAMAGRSLTDSAEAPYLAGTGAIHNYRRLGAAGGLGFSAFGGQINLVGVGVVTRLNLHETDRALVAVQPEVGWMYAALALPLAMRVGDDLWVHTAPSIGYRMLRFGELPIGLTYQSPDGFSLTAEAAVAYGDGTGSGEFLSFAPGTNVLSGRATILLAYRFGRRPTPEPLTR